jgi:hypothetical protein
MRSQSLRLPDRFPVGTRYVIEARAGGGPLRIQARYVEFPDGKHVKLPLRRSESSNRRRPRRRIAR